MNPFFIVTAVVRRELLRAVRNQAEALYPLLFFALCVLLFPFALGTDSALLARIAAGVVWVAALLASALSLEALFRADYADGTLEVLVVGGASLPLLAVGKALAHWLLSGLPVLLLSVPLGLSLHLQPAMLATLLTTLALGTVCMSLIGAAISALTVGLRGGGLLLAMLILPLYIPVLIFGASANANAALGLPVTGELYFLAGLVVLALTLAPWATAAALRIRLS